MIWEYHVEYFTYKEELGDLLNNLGKDGWEVGIIPITTEYGLDAVELIFKRGKVKKVKIDGK